LGNIHHTKSLHDENTVILIGYVSFNYNKRKAIGFSAITILKQI